MWTTAAVVQRKTEIFERKKRAAPSGTRGRGENFSRGAKERQFTSPEQKYQTLVYTAQSFSAPLPFLFLRIAIKLGSTAAEDSTAERWCDLLSTHIIRAVCVCVTPQKVRSQQQQLSDEHEVFTSAARRVLV